MSYPDAMTPMERALDRAIHEENRRAIGNLPLEPCPILSCLLDAPLEDVLSPEALAIVRAMGEKL